MLSKNSGVDANSIEEQINNAGKKEEPLSLNSIKNIINNVNNSSITNLISKRIHNIEHSQFKSDANNRANYMRG